MWREETHIEREMRVEENEREERKSEKERRRASLFGLWPCAGRVYVERGLGGSDR